MPNRTWFRRSRILALLAIHFALGLWLIHASPSPAIDVYFFQRDGINELLAGRNPYAMTYWTSMDSQRSMEKDSR